MPVLLRSAPRALAACVALAWFVFASNSFATAPGIRIQDAWIRWLPAGIPAGGYLTVTNDGERPVTLVGADSAAYGEVSLHISRTQNGVAQMSPVGQIVIGPHASVNFAVAGYHMMLMQPTRPINPGDQVPITLHFADGAVLMVKFAVRRPDGSSDNQKK
jgi:copper(I)-binding protein